MSTTARHTCRRVLLAAVLGMALIGPPALARSDAAQGTVHAHCIPWRGIVLAVGGGALAGWVLMRLGRPQRPPPPPQ
ncbi:hypothetical protein [Sphaerotilus sp.]|uniref:hypothetical protein n=1 Tax=Sphaerotilus sp. TaxID=2093942 RepID=UPI0034E20BD7